MIDTGDPLLNIALTDRAWRLDNLYLVLTEGASIEPFVARPEQREFRDRQHNCNFIPKARKLGMSTEIVIENLDACLFNENFRAAIVDKGEEDAWDKLGIARLAWKNGPSHPDPVIAQIWRILHEETPLIADSNSELAWSNGSRFEAGVSFTGGTLQSLHVSELGPIAAQRPAKAEEIRRGSMNAVVQNGVKNIETTMEGGRMGVCFDYFELALGTGNRDDLEKSEWRLHFFSWLRHPDYFLKNRKPHNAETIKYFRELTEKHGDSFEKLYGWREVPLEKQAWWESKRRELKDDIYQQFPTVVEECVRTVVAGQIYPEIISLRAQGRCSKEFNPDHGIPICTYWDLGAGANLAGWLIQKSGKDINILDWAWGEGKGAGYMAEVIRAWARLYGPIACNFLPHDAEVTDKGSGKTYKSQLIESGVSNREVRVVPRVRQVWDGIEEVRKRIMRMWFHPRTDEKVKSPSGTDLPGGLGRVENYRMTPTTSSGVIKGTPFPDICSHTCFPAGTMVLLQRGEVPIEEVEAGDFVVTPAGLSVVEKAGVTAFTSILVEIMDEGGRKVSCTGNHPFLSGNGLITADSLRTVRDVWNIKSDLKLPNLTELGIGYRDVITSPLRALGKITAIYTGRFGRTITDQFQRIMTSITRIMTTSITTSPTWSASRDLSTRVITPEIANGSTVEPAQRCFWKRLSQPQRNGTPPPRESSGTEFTGSIAGKRSGFSRKTAFFAERNSRPNRGGNYFSKGFANKDITLGILAHLWRKIAVFAATSSLTRLRRRLGSIVPSHVTRKPRLKSERIELENPVPVYDLQIRTHHCYYANGFLVSNCDALRTFAEADWHGLVDSVGHSITPDMMRLQIGGSSGDSIPGVKILRGPTSTLWRG